MTSTPSSRPTRRPPSSPPAGEAARTRSAAFVSPFPAWLLSGPERIASPPPLRPGEPLPTASAPALELPELISRYLDGNLSEQSSSPKIVRICQRGEMRLQPGRPARRFSGVQDHAVAEIAFTWRARFRLGPFVFLQVVDRYERGEGSLEGRWLGLSRFVGQSGSETPVDQALRYLLELPWVPHAMRENGELEWRELDERSVEVATRIGTQQAAVTFEFDAHGDIIGSRCQAHPSPQGNAAVPRPWGGRYSAYETVGGVRIPTRGEVRWQSPDGSSPYWRGTITSVQLDPGTTP